MAGLLLKVVGNISNLVPLTVLEKFSNQKLYCPFYHALEGENALPHIKHLYKLRTVKQFQDDLEFLLKTHQAIGLTDLHAHITGSKSITKKSFHLSFDDGLREVYDFAFPIMKQLGVPSTVFLNSDFIDNKGLFYGYKASLIVETMDRGNISKAALSAAYKLSKSKNTDTLRNYILALRYVDQPILDQLADLFEISFDSFLSTQQPYMTREQIDTMSKAGHSFGGHSVDHPHFDDITLDEQIRQARISTLEAEKLTKAGLTSFAFPFSDAYVSHHFFKENDKNPFTDVIFGTQGYKTDIDEKIIHRHWLEGSDEKTAKFLKTEHAKCILNRLRGANQVIRTDHVRTRRLNEYEYSKHDS